MSLGDKLRTLRLRSKKTLKDQSIKFGVSMNSIYRWEHDLAVPRKVKLKEMTEYYDVPMEWLYMDYDKDNTTVNSMSTYLLNIEQQLLSTFRKLSENSKYKVLGYVERMCIEEYNE